MEMKIQELPARAYLAHLRRHPLPELMDEECVAALANVEAQFGDTITHGAGLRRWIRILPDGEPFIQTLVSYFKLNYVKGRVTEAKAYLEQSPYIHHHYFEAYERPVRLDMELSDGGEVLTEETALAWNRAGTIVPADLRFIARI